MLRGLYHEIVRRRLWPVALLALLVVAAAPLLFLKSSPEGATDPAQAAQDVPRPPGDVRLPARAQRLLTTSDVLPGAHRRKPRKGEDPFQAPAGTRRASKTDAPAKKTPAGGGGSGGSGKPVPVVITGPDGKPAPATSAAGAPAPSATFAAVDVRFAKHGGGALHSAIPRLQPFVATGRVLASFVRYSSSRKAAVFAVAPSTTVTGAGCRKVNGDCRYVDLKAGSKARLTILLPGGAVLTRRLEVVHIAQRSAGSDGEPARPASGRCLLRKLLALGLGDPPVQRAACA